MSFETILNDKDTSCPQCGSELPAGRNVIVDKLDPNAGAFCDEVCWGIYFEVENEEDPYNEIARENGEAAIRRYQDPDDF